MPPVIGLLPQIGPLELLIVLVIVVLILGPKRIPEAARSVGRGLQGFKDTIGGGSDDADRAEKQEIREKSKTGS